jgi:Flp pilus assembly protein TadG
MHARKQSGQAIVELALAMTVLLWFALGSLDFGRAFYTYVGLVNAAREGARTAASLAPACNLTSTQNTVRTEQWGLFPASVPNSIIALDCSAADRRTVTITNYPFTPLTPFIAQALGDGSVMHLSASATMPVVNQ